MSVKVENLTKVYDEQVADQLPVPHNSGVVGICHRRYQRHGHRVSHSWRQSDARRAKQPGKKPPL